MKFQELQEARSLHKNLWKIRFKYARAMHAWENDIPEQWDKKRFAYNHSTERSSDFPDAVIGPFTSEQEARQFLTSLEQKYGTVLTDMEGYGVVEPLQNPHNLVDFMDEVIRSMK